MNVIILDVFFKFPTNRWYSDLNFSHEDGSIAKRMHIQLLKSTVDVVFLKLAFHHALRTKEFHLFFFLGKMLMEMGKCWKKTLAGRKIFFIFTFYLWNSPNVK